MAFFSPFSKFEKSSNTKETKNPLSKYFKIQIYYVLLLKFKILKEQTLSIYLNCCHISKGLELVLIVVLIEKVVEGGLFLKVFQMGTYYYRVTPHFKGLDSFGVQIGLITIGTECLFCLVTGTHMPDGRSPV